MYKQTHELYPNKALFTKTVAKGRSVLSSEAALHVGGEGGFPAAETALAWTRSRARGGLQPAVHQP